METSCMTEERCEGRTQLWMPGSGVEEQDTEQAVCDEDKREDGANAFFGNSL